MYLPLCLFQIAVVLEGLFQNKFYENCLMFFLQNLNVGLFSYHAFQFEEVAWPKAEIKMHLKNSVFLHIWLIRRRKNVKGELLKSQVEHLFKLLDHQLGHLPWACVSRIPQIF